MNDLRNNKAIMTSEASLVNQCTHGNMAVLSVLYRVSHKTDDSPTKWKIKQDFTGSTFDLFENEFRCIGYMESLLRNKLYKNELNNIRKRNKIK